MIDLQFQFKSLFTINVTHTYYAGRGGRDIKFIPSRSTAQLINKLGLLLRQEDGVLHVLHDAERIEAFKYKLEKTDLTFSFWMTTNNVYFRNITDLPTEYRDSILFFKNPGGDSNGTTRLHKDEFVNGKDACHVRPDYFDYKVADGTGELQLRDDNGNLVFEKEVNPEISSSTSFTNLPEGKYSLYVNNKEKENFVAVADRIKQPPLALVQVELTYDMKKELLNSIDIGQPLPFYNFNINFRARSTFWKYMVVSKYVKDMKGTTIFSEKKGVSFSTPEEVKLVDGEMALSFSSNEALPLMEYSNFHFQLRKKNGGAAANKVLVKRLPVPPIDSIKPETRDANSKIYSEILIYI